MQDSATWLQEGAVDLLLPQLYRDNLAGFRQVLEGNLRPLAAERRRRLVAGLTLKANGVELPAETLVQMVQLCREQGLGGMALFHHTPLMGGDQRVARALREKGGLDQVAVLPSWGATA